MKRWLDAVPWEVWAALALIVLLFTAGACSASAVQTQAMTADGIARVLNAGEPVWIAAYETECSAVADTTRGTLAQVTAAVDACDARWAGVTAAHETLAHAHHVWAAAVTRCRAQVTAGAPESACMPDVLATGADLVRAANGWRCEVRALGHRELDVLPGEPACSSGGGAP